MSRAERRRAERAAQKQKYLTDKNIQTPVISSELVGAALYKKELADKIDRELGARYYRQASKESCDNMYYIMLCSMALALHDLNPKWGSEPIGNRLNRTMYYIDKFANEYDGDIQKFIKEVEESTGLIITVDSVPEKQ